MRHRLDAATRTGNGSFGRRTSGLPPAHETIAHGTVVSGSARHLPDILRLMKEGAAEGLLVMRTRTEILKDIRRGNCFLYEKQGAVAGMAFLTVYDRRFAELRSLYVLREERSNGAGPSLVRSVSKRAAELGIAEVMVITTPDRTDWFRKHGFGTEAHGFKVAMFANAD